MRSRLRELVEQSQRLLDKQLEVEGRYLEGLAKLQAAEGQLLEAARSCHDFLKANLFWLRSRPATGLGTPCGPWPCRCSWQRLYPCCWA